MVKPLDNPRELSSRCYRDGKNMKEVLLFLYKLYSNGKGVAGAWGMEWRIEEFNERSRRQFPEIQSREKKKWKEELELYQGESAVPLSGRAMIW